MKGVAMAQETSLSRIMERLEDQERRIAKMEEKWECFLCAGYLNPNETVQRLEHIESRLGLELDITANPSSGVRYKNVPSSADGQNSGPHQNPE